jgi:hypothetical protein
VSDLPLAAIVHETPGRTRLRLAERREDESFFAFLCGELAQIPGVRRADAAPLTGGILLLHDKPLSEIAEAAEAAGLFRLLDGAAKLPAEQSFELRITPRMAAAIGLGLIAAWQLHKEKLFPSAFTVAWHALDVAGLLRTRGADGGWSFDE